MHALVMQSAHALAFETVDVCMQTEADAPVAIYAEGKTHAMAVGLTKMSTQQMREVNKGIGVDNIHYLNDGLWKNRTFT